MTKNQCTGYWFNFDWVTKEIYIDWIFGYEVEPGQFTPGGPWWTCIKCQQIFHSASMCACKDCNPFSGYCRKCSA